ncbi:pectinesterase [Colletotrichum orchidophilum]|uniref:pectinesterase n=1 Tax=Colletotrichum orchidophilum TaxID=1209926 RepID=A0A1G4AYA1_9PEZI|nr:pectinesterase [Colletotrichum orchidophilum]OHE94124.1 pectinesterase [Colletotrichum orchidophilum]
MLASSLVLLSSLVAGAFGAARTSPPSGALVVAKSGGKYTSIQKAVDAASSGAVIFIQPGTYNEQVLIPAKKGALTIYGYTANDQDYSKNQVTITNSLGADEAGNNDASGTFRAKNDNLKVYNINIVNSRGKGVQAIALSAYGNQQGYYGIQAKGYQDTVLSNQGKHYFHNSYIEGATDFIFGQRAIAWFEACTIAISGKGYITASGRDAESNPSWYVINKSTVKALSGVGDGNTFLGRPWRTFARVVVQNSNLGSVVNAAGWSKWGSNPTDNVVYQEYANTGKGASGTRASFSKKISAAVKLGDILGSTSWIDSKYTSGSTARSTSESAAVAEPAVADSKATPTTLQTVVKASPTPAPQAAAADDDCSGTPDGFASLNGGTTGGKGGEVVTVKTQADLEKYASASGKYVIKVSGKITITPKGKEIKVSSDKTIVGLGDTAEIDQGGFNVQNQKNIIFRNIKIGNTYVEGDKQGKTQDFDGIQMDNSTNIWIDHVHLERGGDGLIDSRKDTTFLTVSWTILRNHNKAFGIGWTDNVDAEITIHHNYFDQTTQRNPSVDNVKHAHLYNNYLVGQTSYGHYARGKTEMRMENCYFDQVQNPIQLDATAKLSATGNVFESTTGSTARNAGPVFDPRTFYEYTLDAAADVPSVVAKGAGRQASICAA